MLLCDSEDEQMQLKIISSTLGLLVFILFCILDHLIKALVCIPYGLEDVCILLGKVNFYSFEALHLETDMEDPHGRELLTLETGEVTSCEISLTYTLAIGSSDKSVRILEWKPGLGFVDLFYSPLIHHKYGVTVVKFSPKGTMLVSASLDGTAILIDVFSGTKIFTMVQHSTSDIKFCEFTFDCTKLLTASDDGVICFWDLVHHCQIRHFRLHEDDYSLKGLTISPDSEYLLSVDSGNLLKLWVINDVNNQPECLLLKKNIHDDVSGCDFSPVKNITGGAVLKLGYRFVTYGDDNLLKVWDLTLKKDSGRRPECHLTLFRFLKHDNDILKVGFSSEGNYLVTTGLDSLVRLWETHTGNCLEILQGHTRLVTCAAFSKDSILLATGSIDRTLVIWDLSQKLTLDSELLFPCEVASHFTNVDTIKYSTRKKRPNEKKMYNEFDIVQKINFSSTVHCVMFQGDILAVAGGKKPLTVCRKQGGNYEESELLKEHECSINYLDVSTCGKKIISSSVDGIMIFWDLNMNLTYKMETPNCTGSIRICKFSPDSKFIAAGGDDQIIYLWDANNLEFIKTLQQHENTITALAFTPDSEFLVSSCCGSEIILQDLEQNKLTTKIHNAHDLGVLCCDFCTAGLEADCSDTYNRSEKINLLATGGNDSLVKLWKVSPSEIQMLKVLSGHGSAVNCVKFSPAEPFILASCSSDNTVRIWNAKTTDCVHVLNCHRNVVTTCSFSEASSLLATGSLDKTVLIHNFAERFYHEPNDQDSYSNKLLEKWTTSDLLNWFLNVGCPEIADKIHAKKLTGMGLLKVSEGSIPDLLGLSSEKERNEFRVLVLMLKKTSSFPRDILCQERGKKVPHKFLCPITHQIMREPVICSDGYVYDREALTEWFLGGKLTSPVTKECLTTTNLLPYSALKINIYKFLYDSEFYT